MANNLQSILGYVTLTGMIEKIRSGVPNPFPPAFFKEGKRCIGDAGRYTEVTGTRQTARVVAYGAPALARGLRNVASRDVKLLHTLEKQPLDPITLQMLRNYDNYNEMQLGKQELARQTKEFAQLGQNLRITAVALALSNGRIGIDANGNLLPDSSWSSATQQVVFQIPANNQTQLNGVISASWANNTTDIPLQLRTLKQTAVLTTGYELKDIYYGINIPSYITQNDFCLDYLARNPGENAEFLNTGEVGTLFGFTWHPVYTSFWDSSTDPTSETTNLIFGADNITVTPPVSDDWYELLTGSYMVPQSINITTDAEAALANLKQVWGMFGYGIVTHDPPGILEYMGDTFLPVIKNGAAIYQADVTP